MNPRSKRYIFLASGPLAFLSAFLILSNSDLSIEVVIVIAAASWMLFWWILEAVSLPVTALLPVVIFPLAGIFSIKEATAPYANPVIFLFLGGFILALALEKHRLHERIALQIIRWTGTGTRSIVLGFMLATAALSMWISNTATAIMLLPMAISAAQLIKSSSKHFGLCLMLGIAYAANIGGIATLIGTPPNAVLVNYMQEFYDIDLGFDQWLFMVFPIMIVLLLLTYLLLTRVLFKIDNKTSLETASLINEQWKKLGPLRPAEKVVAVIFGLTACAWIFRQLLNATFDWQLNDTAIAMIGALAMFVAPQGLASTKPVLHWKDTQKLQWGILILFGGGLCMARAMEHTGIIQIIGQWVVENAGANPFLLMLLLTTLVLFMTELMSNVALISIFLPVIIGIADGLQMNPLYLCIPATLAASCAFMMPISTPPNAIVFSSGYIKIKQMLRAGIWLNLISILLLVVLSWLILPYFLE